MHIGLRTCNAGVSVIQISGLEDFGFVDELVVVAQCGFIKGINLLFWGLGLGCFFYKGHGRNGEVHGCRLLVLFWDSDYFSTFSKHIFLPTYSRLHKKVQVKISRNIVCE